MHEKRRQFIYLWMLYNCTMFGWFRKARRNMISLNVRWASVSLRNASKIFLTATISCVFRSIAFHTIPYAPLPKRFRWKLLKQYNLMIRISFKPFIIENTYAKQSNDWGYNEILICFFFQVSINFPGHQIESLLPPRITIHTNRMPNDWMPHK